MHEAIEEVHMNKVKSIIFGLVVGLVSFAGINYITGDAVDAASRECDSNAIIRCGAMTEAELAQKYAANTTGDLDNIYSAYGITGNMIANHAGTLGYVTKTGDVVVDGKVVATDAYSLGRMYRSGSIAKTIDGVKYYEGSTSVRFAATRLDAFVYRDTSGKFIGAILLICGNAIRATPVPQPVYKCDGLTATKISRNEYSFTTKAVAANGATLRDYSYNFGDGTTAAAGATTKHTYAKPGTYTVRVNVRVTVNGQTVNAPGDCVVTVPVAPEPCPIPGKESLPKDSPLCVEDKPSVSIDKTVNGAEHASVKVGEYFTYRLIVKNTGNVMLDDTKVTDEAPAGISFVSSVTGEIVNNAWSTVIDDLEVGESKTFEITAKLTKYVAGTIKNTACVDTPTVPGKLDDCDDATVDTPKLLEVCRLEDKAIVTINDDQFDATKYSEDKTKCAEAPNPKADTPVTELPKTGIVDSIGGGVGLGAIAASLYYYRASRRLL